MPAAAALLLAVAFIAAQPTAATSGQLLDPSTAAIVAEHNGHSAPAVEAMSSPGSGGRRSLLWGTPVWKAGTTFNVVATGKCVPWSTAMRFTFIWSHITRNIFGHDS